MVLQLLSCVRSALQCEAAGEAVFPFAAEPCYRPLPQVDCNAVGTSQLMQALEAGHHVQVGWCGVGWAFLLFLSNTQEGGLDRLSCRGGGMVWGAFLCVT